MKFDLIQTGTTLTEISISWSPPTKPNGIITVYEIRYRESTSTGSYKRVTSITNTQYSIVGLIRNTTYNIGVRAYTSIGPGEWTDAGFTSAQICKIILSLIIISIFISAMIGTFL